MTFKQFVHAIKSAWSAASNVTILLAVLAGIGVSSVWSEVPSAVSMVACLLFYLAGFLASCYRSADETGRRQEYVVESLEESVDGNERFGAAFRDIEKYGCVGGSRTAYSPKKGFSTALYPDGPYVLRTDYPSLWERERRDIVIEARDEAIREFERKSAERRRREMM